MDGSEGTVEGANESHTLFLDSATWREAPRTEGVEIVMVLEDSAVELIQENLTINERGFDPNASAVDEIAADAFRSRLRGCAAMTMRCDGLSVAAGMFNPVHEGRCELVGITTLAKYRRRGFGTALTSRLARAALDAGAKTVFLTTDDETALRSYRRVGFREA